MAAKTKSKGNIIRKLALRETLGSLRPATRAKTVKLFDNRAVCIPLNGILDTDGVLQKGHVLLGFTKDGRYLISYEVTIDADFNSPLPHYIYSLYWWEFHQRKPLVQVYSVPLFQDEDIQHELHLLVSQTLDETQVVVWGISHYQEASQSRGCFVTVCSAPPNKPCGSCAAQVPPGRCIQHSYVVHMKYDLLPPFPRFIPSLCLRLNDVILFNTGDQLMALTVHTKCCDSPVFSAGRNHFQSGIKEGSHGRISCEVSPGRRNEAGGCDGSSVEVTNGKKSEEVAKSCCCCPRRDVSEHRRPRSECVPRLPKDFIQKEQRNCQPSSASKFVEQTACACFIVCETSRTDLPGLPGNRLSSSEAPEQKRKNSYSPEQETKDSDIPEQNAKASDAPEHETKFSDALEQKTKVSDTPEQQTKISDTPEQQTKVSDVTEQETKVSDAPLKEARASEVPEQEAKVSDAPKKEARASEVPEQETRTSEQSSENSETEYPTEDFDCFVESDVEEGRLSDSFGVEEQRALTVFTCKVYAESDSDESDSETSFDPGLLPVTAPTFSGKTLRCVYTDSSHKDATCDIVASELACFAGHEVLVVKQACLDIEQCINQLIQSHEVLRTRYKSLSDYDAQIVDVNPESCEVTVLVKLLLYTRTTSMCTLCDIPVSPRPILQSCGFIFTWNVQSGLIQRLATMQLAHYSDVASKSEEHRATSEVTQLRKHCFIPVGVPGSVHTLSNHSTFSGKSLKYLRHPYLPLAIVFRNTLSHRNHNSLRA